MDFRIRLFLDSVIDLVNEYGDIPLEARRLVLESAMRIVEKKADEAIVRQRAEIMDNPGEMESEGGNAENIHENKLGELPE